jgi:hypothetical protein
MVFNAEPFYNEPGFVTLSKWKLLGDQEAQVRGTNPGVSLSVCSHVFTTATYTTNVICAPETSFDQPKLVHIPVHICIRHILCRNHPFRYLVFQHPHSDSEVLGAPVCLEVLTLMGP